MRSERGKLLLVFAIAWIIFFFELIATHTYAAIVNISGQQLMVDGSPFTIKGVGYSPVPIGVDPETTPPYGDYFTSNYSAIYERDLPLLREMGANTIRLWGWNNTADHSDFLNKAYNNGVDPIYVIVTFWIGPSSYPDISSPSARAQIKDDFRAMVAAHKDHPAVFMWSIGNELNASWMYGDKLNDLFSLINEMAQEAHQEEGSNYHPVITPLLDNNMINTIATFDLTVTSLDAWGANVYRGQSFGTLFNDYKAVSGKPLMILEFGIDAYDNQHNDEYEDIGLPYQAIYAEALWREIRENSDVCPGGVVMAYSDEWWKGKYSTDPGCPDNDPVVHSKCGYATGSHPDGYSNEEWWGIMRIANNGDNPDIMESREVYYTFQYLWKGVADCPSYIFFGETISCSIGTPGENQTYIFSANANDKVIVKMTRTSGTLNPQIRISGPDGVLLCTGNPIPNDKSSAEISSCSLTSSGLHTIIASDDVGTDAGNYNLALERLNVGCGASIAFGETKSGSLSLGDLDSYTFSGNANDRIFVRMTRASGTLEPQIRVYGPDGGKVCEVNAGYPGDVADLLSCLLPGAGIHTIVVGDYILANYAYYRDGSGEYNITLSIGNGTPIACGETKSGSLVVGDLNSYVFTGNANDKVIVKMTRTSGTLNPQIRIIGPDAGLLCTANPTIWNNSAEISSCTLTSSGLHTIIASDAGGTDAGNYNLTLERLNVGCGPSIAFGETKSVALLNFGDLDSYTFTGNAGDEVFVRMSRTSGSLKPQIRVYGPDGGKLCESGSGFGDFDTALVSSCLLPGAGTHTIVVNDYIGMYSYADGSGGYYVTLGEIISSPNTPAGPNNGTQGTSYTYYVWGSSSNFFHTIEYLFDWGDGTDSGWLPANTTSASHGWAYVGTFSVRAKARCATHTSIESNWSGVLNLLITEAVSTPNIPSGPTSGIPGISYTYSASGSSSGLGHNIQYFFDWGDGTNSGWLPVGITSSSKSWSYSRTYGVKAKARCATDTSIESSWSGTLSVIISLSEAISAPDVPSGRTIGATDTSYGYSTGGSSSNFGHSIQYLFDWGDGTNSGWLPVNTTSASKSWASTGTYSVKAKARCSIDTAVESTWSGNLAVTIYQIQPLPLDVPKNITVSGEKLVFETIAPQGLADLFILLQKEASWSGTIKVSKEEEGICLGETTGSNDSLLHIASPAAGNYLTEVSGYGSGLLTAKFTLRELPIDQLVIGTIYRNDGFDWLQMDVPAGITGLDFTVETVGNISDLDVWRSSFSSNEHWHARQSFNPPIKLTIQNPAVGRYYLRVYDHGELSGGSQVRDYSIIVRTVQGTEMVSTPVMPGGTSSGMPGIDYAYSTGGSFSSLGHSIQYFFDWGEGTNSGWLPVGTTSASKSLASPGTYTVKAKARCVTDTSIESNWSGVLNVVISTTEAVSQPNTPSGPTNGIPGTGYGYSTWGSSSNLGHGIQYFFDWGDGTDSGWLSTEVKIASKNWASSGTYQVKVKARCSTDTSIESSWSGVLWVTITNTLAITNVSPATGANTGPVTVTFTGVNLDANSQVKLTKTDEADIIPKSTTGSADATRLIATFDLKGKTEGIWNFVITNSIGQSATFQTAFTIESGCQGKLWVEIIGLKKIRAGRKYTIQIHYGNSCNVDAIGVPLWISGIPADAIWNLNFQITPPPSGSEWSSLPAYFVRNGEVSIPLLIPKIAAGQSYSLSMTIQVSRSEDFQLRTWFAQPWFPDPSTSTPNPEVVKCLTNIGLDLWGLIPGAECPSAALDFTFEAMTYSPGKDNPLSVPWSFLNMLKECGGTFVPEAKLILDLGELWLDYGPGSDCYNILRSKGEGLLLVGIVSAWDPNDKAGPSGYDVEGTPPNQRNRFIAGGHPIEYVVHFENLETATAAVQDMSIIDHLDPNLDWLTFAFDMIQIGTHTISLPQGSQSFITDVGFRPEMSAIVQVRCTFDTQTGVAQWYFKGVDPDTGELADFLPPNTDNIDPRGQGWVSYSVNPKSNLPTGTVIKNKATIDFEVGVPPAPMDTPEVVNTIDSVAPSSSVSPLAATQNSTTFAVSWSGSDDSGGSGIKNYDIFVSDNGSPYTLWLTTSDTSATFTGECGRQYSFYSRARDNVGNLEDIPAVADGVTTIAYSTSSTPSNPSPSDGAKGVLTALNLSWAACSNTESYDVYFDTSPNPPFVGNTTSASYPLPALSLSSTYYWKIVAKNNCSNHASGPIWGFTTSFFNVTPKEGTFGTEITLTGSGFGSKKGKILIGSTLLTIGDWADGLIHCSLKKVLTPGHYDVTIQPAGPKGTPTILAKNAFEVKAAEIHSIEQSDGSAYDKITIKGEFLGTSKGKVYLEYMKGEQLIRKSCTVSSWTMNKTSGDSEIVFIVPVIPNVECDVIVDPYSTIQEIKKDHGFEVKAPKIESVNPNSTSVGSQATISGNFFGSKKPKVYLGYLSKGKPTKKSCSIISWDDDEIVFLVPKLPPGAYDVIVTNSVGWDQYDQKFNIE